MRSVIAFVKKNTVLCIAILAALVTSFIVKPDKEYLGYFDLKTLTCLFCVLAVVCALKNINFFYTLADKIVSVTGNIRVCILTLVSITFIGSMLIANDMALLTFLPLGYFVLSTTDKKKYMSFTFIMQNIAANLGGMLTPFGNPQNLYLYTKFNIPTGEFVRIMILPFVISIALILGPCYFFVKPEKITIKNEDVHTDKKRTVIYLILFAISILIVFRGIPYYVGLALILPSIFILDRRALAKVDYPLLLTFVAFFIFSGNMARIEVVREFFGLLMEKNTLLFSVLSCQVISNVPSAILLSQFTGNYTELLLGVNIGGVGTLISSLASLITLREFTLHNPLETKRYIVKFSAFNFAFLFLLTGIMLFVV